jgi:hypothetical protein
LVHHFLDFELPLKMRRLKKGLQLIRAELSRERIEDPPHGLEAVLEMAGSGEKEASHALSGR